MGKRLKRGVYAIAALAGVYAGFLFVLAVFAYLYLLSCLGPDAYTGAALIGLLGFLLVVLSGIVPSMALRKTGFRRAAVYVLSGLWAGLFAAYGFFYMFGVMENAGAILRHVQDNTEQGWHYVVPAFVDVLRDTFFTVPKYIADACSVFGMDRINIIYVYGFIRLVAIVSAFGTFFGWLYWRLRVRRLLKAA